MRLDLVLASLLSVAVAAAATDTASAESGQSGVETATRRENAQRRVKKSMMGGDEYVIKDDNRGYGNAPSYNGRQPAPSLPPRPMYPANPSPYYPPRKSSSVSRKKYKDPKGHSGDRLMYSGSNKGKGGKGGKGKGKGYTYPPSPRPPATPAPNPPTPGGTPAPSVSPPNEGCKSLIAQSITDQVPQAITRNPPRCCDGNAPAAVFVTHADPDESTFSGFEPFWDAVYTEVLRTTSAMGVCFVMTGYDAGAGTVELPLVLLDVIGVSSTMPEVPALMTTDPTDDVVLMQAIRSVSSNSLLSSIGVFNAGFNNIVVESIVSGQDRLPFVGYLSDAEYGTEAGRVSLRLLDGTPAVPLCYNARLGVVPAIAERCASFYAEVTSSPVITEEGVACSADSEPQDLANQIIAIGANVVWSHVDCCQVVLEAVGIARQEGMNIFVGCQDIDTTGGAIDFLTQQPIELQAYQAASWASFPVLQAQQEKDGRGDQFFPSLQTLVNTGIFSVILL